MKKIALAIIMMLAFAGSASAGAIDFPSNQSHIHTLQSLDKAGLVTLLNEYWPGSFKTSDIGQFRWADLGGNGQ